MNLLLINASLSNPEYISNKTRIKMSTYPSLGLALLAALTPPEFNVKIINEECENLDFDAPVDLVGISFLTPSAPRAYEIADVFRKKSIPVVLGGVHTSAMPNEAIEHADAIVIGEAENIWTKLLEDFKTKNLQKFYKANDFVDLTTLPIPRRELLNKKIYLSTNVIQASRGCPQGCEFCSVDKFFGKKARFRPMEDVIEEIKAMNKQKFLLFTDDNLIINPSYLEKLLTELIPLKRKWLGEATWVIGHKPEIIKLMRKSGCLGLFIGFESIRTQPNIKKTSIHRNMRNAYMQTVKNLHKNRIGVLGAFIFGFDNDDLSSFDETLKFCLDADMDAVQFSSLIPFPGTPLIKRLTKEGRIITRDWSKYTYEPPGKTFYPRNMTCDELERNIGRIYREFYSFKHLLPRLIRALFRYKSLASVFYLFLVFINFRKRSKVIPSTKVCQT
jgi:radical SAM superfamily enzyme YgiQ (UPF0313 family)